MTASAPTDIALRASSSSQCALSESELTKRLKIRSPKIVAEVYSLARLQVQTETGRQQRLDTKATSLLTAVGLSLTVAFTFGGVLMKQVVASTKDISGVKYTFGAAVLLGLGAGASALIALLVRGLYKTLSESAVLNKDALDVADGQDIEEMGLAAYQRFMTIQFLEIARAHGSIHETKATIIKVGQVMFAGFIFSLFLFCVFVMGQF